MTHPEHPPGAVLTPSISPKLLITHPAVMSRLRRGTVQDPYQEVALTTLRKQKSETPQLDYQELQQRIFRDAQFLLTVTLDQLEHLAAGESLEPTRPLSDGGDPELQLPVHAGRVAFATEARRRGRYFVELLAPAVLYRALFADAPVHQEDDPDEVERQLFTYKELRHNLVTRLLLENPGEPYFYLFGSVSYQDLKNVAYQIRPEDTPCMLDRFDRLRQQIFDRRDSSC